MKTLLCGILLAATLAFGQSTPSRATVLSVEQSVPFGTVSGQLLALPDYLVFVDSQQIENSYVVPRTALESLNTEGTAITIQTREPVRDRSGEVTRLNFRVLSGDAAALNTWRNLATADRADRIASAIPDMYEASHDHTFGACHGRLVISDTQLSFESIDNLDHTRRWEYSSIRELKQNNPYDLEIKSARGDYNLKLSGAGMDPATFKQLVERVTAARVGGRR